MNVELSIVMPIFNRKALVKIMIESILANDFTNWELLAIDDGSTDGSIEMLQNYVKADSRITLCKRRRMPKGAQTCRNLGLELAKGEYIIFFDSDDYITSECLRHRVDLIRQNPTLDFMVFPFGIFEEQEAGIHRVVGGVPTKGSDISKFIERSLPFMVWTNIYKTRSLLDNNLWWDISLKSLQDADFNLSAILAGLKYGYGYTDTDYYIRYTNNGQSISKRVLTPEHYESHIYAINKFYAEIQLRFGKKYNNQLYRGVLWIYNKVSQKTFNLQFAETIYTIVSKYDKYAANRFRRVYFLQQLLVKVTPFSYNNIRKIVLAPYLFTYRLECWWRKM